MGNSTKHSIVPPPPGVQSNWVNPESTRDWVIATNTTCLFLVSLFLVMRLYTRKVVAGKLALDDYCCILAFCLTVLYSGLNITAQAYGIGHHAWDVTHVTFVKGYKFAVIAVWVYNLVQMSVKLTCLLFYRNIFHPTHKTLFFVNAGIAFVLVAYLSLFTAHILQCHPIAYFWDRSVKGGYCFQPEGIAYTTGGVTAFSDLYTLIVPIPAVMGLPLSTARKLRILSVFSLGIFACAASIVRIVLMVQQWHSIDFTWQSMIMGMWSTVEVDVGLVCACLFVLPAFLKHHKKHIPKWLSCLGETSPNSFETETKPTDFDRSLWRGNRSDERNLNSMEIYSEDTSRASTRHTDDEWMGHNRTRPLTRGE